MVYGGYTRIDVHLLYQFEIRLLINIYNIFSKQKQKSGDRDSGISSGAEDRGRMRMKIKDVHNVGGIAEPLRPADYEVNGEVLEADEREDGRTARDDNDLHAPD